MLVGNVTTFISSLFLKLASVDAKYTCITSITTCENSFFNILSSLKNVFPQTYQTPETIHQLIPIYHVFCKHGLIISAVRFSCSIASEFALNQRILNNFLCIFGVASLKVQQGNLVFFSSCQHYGLYFIARVVFPTPCCTPKCCYISS